VAPDQRRQEVGCHLAVGTVKCVYQALAIDGVHYRLAEVDVVEFFDLVVEGQIAGVQRRFGVNVQIGVGISGGNVFRRSLFQSVDVAGFKSQEAGRVIGDYPENDLVNRWATAPIIVIGGQGDVVALNPFHKLEGASAHAAH